MKRLFYILLSVSTILSSCSDDDSFSTSRGDLLSFACDTLSLDTVFSTVPTRTYGFWAYNRSSDGLRVSQVRLEHGNQTGFRVNVDGIYLDNSTGSQAQDIEVRKGDSIRVFVELTSQINGSDVPQLIEDNLSFRLQSGVEQKVNLRAWSWDAVLYDSLRVSKNTTIASSKPVVVRGGIRVDSAATLSILSPTVLYFGSTAGIDVYGTLEISGQPGQDVVLRGDRLDNMFDYLPYDRVSGQWRGIHFFGSSSGNSLRYLDLHSAMDAILCDSVDICDTPNLSLANVTIHNCKGYGFAAFHSNISMANTLISNTLADCLYLYRSQANVTFSTFAQFYPFDANRGDALTFTDTIDTAKRTIRRLDVANSIITGYADDVIMAYLADTVAKPYRFSHCMLRTPTPSDTTCFKRIIWEDVEDTVIAGWKNFMKVDTDLLQYDFSLPMSSLAIDAADPSTSPSDDRNGTQRDSKPDMGCYEAIREE